MAEIKKYEQIRPKSPVLTQGPCGNFPWYPDLLREHPAEIKAFWDKQGLQPTYDQELDVIQVNRVAQETLRAIYDLQRRVCLLENRVSSGVIAEGETGIVTFTPELHTYGLLTLNNLTIATAENAVAVHAIVSYVNEIKDVYATLSTTLTSTPATEDISVSVFNEDITDPEMQFVSGDYIFFVDDTIGGDSEYQWEIAKIEERIGSTWSVSRIGYFGSQVKAHATSVKIQKVQLKQFTEHLNINPWFESVPLTTVPPRMDFLWPSRMILSVGAGSELLNGYSALTTVSTLQYDEVGTPPELPVSPGMRTLAGQAYIIPALIAIQTVVADAGYQLRTKDAASIRTVNATLEGAATGADMIIEVKYRPATGGAWQLLEEVTIPDGQTNSYAVSGPNANLPQDRRMPYTIDYKDLPVVPQDAEIGFDVTQIGSSAPGTGLTVYLET